MTTATWEQLHARLDVRSPAGKGKPGAPPTDAALDDFERQYGLTLPAGYRAFVKVFGPGEIAGVVRIYAPVGKGRPGDLGTYVDDFRANAGFLGKAYHDPKLIKRAVPFANTVFGDMIVWDPEHAAGGKAGDYAIVYLPDDKSKPKALAPDFRTFVEDRCLSREFGAYIDDPDYEPDQTFVPFDAMRA